MFQSLFLMICFLSSIAMAKEHIEPFMVHDKQCHYAYIPSNQPCRSEGSYITLFSHGIGGTYRQAFHYHAEQFFCQEYMATFNYPDAPESIPKHNPYTGLAQASEIECLKRAFFKTERFGADGIILYGISRGASTIVNMVADLHKQGYNTSAIKAIILESPFADCEDTLIAYAAQSRMPVFFVRFLIKRFFKEYDRYANKPINAVPFIPHDIPILLVSLRTDIIVPYASTIKLYDALKNSGHPSTHLLPLFGNGMHAHLFHAEQGDHYAPALHAFYQRYNLPHDQNAAIQGATYFG